jgi:acyl-CoA hydrolase
MARGPLPMERAVERLYPRDSLGIPLGPGQPPGFLHALGERDDWEQLTVFGALLGELYTLFTRPGVRYLSGFFGPAERFLVDSGADVEFIPADFRRFIPVAERLNPRIVATVAAPPDADGNLSLSLHAGATIGEVHRAAEDPDRLLIVEINSNCPRTFGLPPEHPHALRVDEVDVLVESDRAILTIEDAEPTDVDRAIAGHARSFIADGATLQTGIGGIPSTVVTLLASEEGGDYGIHSEMFTTGLMQLHRAGKVSNLRKGVFPGFSVTTFAAGTAELYTWLDGNTDVRFLPVDVVNSPHTIASNHNVVTINGALAVDLWGQAAADALNARQYSGIGGHEDFVAVSGYQLEDRSLLCLPSVATIRGDQVSRIGVHLPPGATVTTPRHQVDVVITEFGIAELRGRTVRERGRALAAIAHPDFRDELREAAEQLG